MWFLRQTKTNLFTVVCLPFLFDNRQVYTDKYNKRGFLLKKTSIHFLYCNNTHVQKGRPQVLTLVTTFPLQSVKGVTCSSYEQINSLSAILV